MTKIARELLDFIDKYKELETVIQEILNKYPALQPIQVWRAIFYLYRKGYVKIYLEEVKKDEENI
ncbi:MAG: hypothetical protein QXF86_03170 [Candidatus Bilamarchaeaceae archaeon]